MIKRLVFSFLLAGSCLAAMAQLGENEDSHIPKVIPPSPDAAALEKFTGIPVDYSTGIPSISYPMWSWERGALKFSLGLSYHAGGHKVDDIASNVGLGWSLSGLPRISRTVRGVPDENATKGFFNTPALPIATTHLYQHEEYYIAEFLNLFLDPPSSVVISMANGGGVYDTLEAISKSWLDGEQDLFSFNMGGHSGRFIMSKAQAIIPLEETNVKIEKIGANIAAGFRITSDDGIIYEFTQWEMQSSETHTDSETIQEATYTDYISSWLIKKIINSNTNDSIVFNYGDSYMTSYETGFTLSTSRLIDKFIYAVPPHPSLGHYSATQSMSIISNSGHLLSSIHFPDSSKVIFDHDLSRDDLDGGQALTGVQVKNCYDEKVREWELHYSYFAASNDNPVPWGWGYFSESDYQKRLCLDSISEKSNSGADNKLTRFTYNSTQLNSRGSANIDFWGYNVNPIRNNTSYMPAIKLEPYEAFLLGTTHLAGANRMPDPEFGKAALLEKITYPTGGFVEFAYESNTTSTDIDYNQATNWDDLEWEEPDYNVAQNLLLPERNTETVYFLFKTIEEIQPRPEQDPEEPASCFENQQDEISAYFQILDGDNNVIATIGQYYGDFINGIDTSFALPTDDTYKVKFVYDDNATCADQYPFTARASFYCANEGDELVGGMRIKKITADPDGTGTPLVKEYSYKKLDGRSSATLRSIPNFRYYRYTTSVCLNYLCSEFYWAKYIKQTSNPVNSLNYHNGGPLVYTRVIEKEADGSYIERQYDDMIFQGMGGNENEFPFPGVQDMPNLSGLLTKEIVVDADNTVVREKEITYDKTVTDMINDPDHRSIKSGIVSTLSIDQSPTPFNFHVLVPTYYRITYAKKTSEETKTWENGEYLVTVSDYTYYPNNYLATVVSTNSKGESRGMSMRYVADGSGTVIDAMKTRNMISLPRGKEYYKYGILDGDLNATRVNYDDYQGGTLYAQSTVETKLLLNDYETEITISGYDEHGNITEFTGKDGVINSFIWGYQGQYPVAKIIGKSYSDVISEASTLDLGILNEPADEEEMREELDKLRALSNCMVTTLTYKPLVGATSETDPNGRSLFYEYDDFNRLALIRDNDSNVLKKFCYSYTGKPIDCGYATFPAWQAISTTCELDEEDVPTGNTIITEKDMNPASATYGETREIIMAFENSVCASCTGDDKKVVNGVCETGTKVCTSSVRINSTTWLVTYHYVFSDSSVTENFQEYGFPCFDIDPF